MANEITSLFGSLPESQTNDGKIILHTDNGAERSSVALSELVGGGSCIEDGGTLIDDSIIDVPNNASSTLTSDQETLTLNVNVDEGEVPNFAVEILAETNIELTVTKTVGDGTPVTLYASSTGGSSLVSGKYYQVTCIGNCWTLAEFIYASPTPTPPDPNPLNLPSHTIRVKFKQGFTPSNVTDHTFDSITLVDSVENIYDLTKNSNDWTGLFSADSYLEADVVLEVLGANSTGVTKMYNMYASQEALTSVAYSDTSSVTDMSNMFLECYGLLSLPEFDTSNVVDFANFASGCSLIQSIPAYNLNKVMDMSNAFAGCVALTEIPDFDCDDIGAGTDELNVCNAFLDCRNVETGITRMYNKLKDKEYWTDEHYAGTFLNCGVDTETGRAELAGIPNGWKTAD